MCFYFLVHRLILFKNILFLLNKKVLTFFRKVKNGSSCIGILLVYVVFGLWNNRFYFLFNNNCLEFKNKTSLSICWNQFQFLKPNRHTILIKERQQRQQKVCKCEIFICMHNCTCVTVNSIQIVLI